MGNFKNVKIGTVFHRLTVIDVLQTRDRNVYWVCKCECGNISTSRAYSITKGMTRSCGCLSKERWREYISNHNPNKFKKPVYSRMNQLVKLYQNGAMKRGLLWDLSIEQCELLFNSNCYYCGCDPGQTFCRVKNDSAIKYNGIDRVDNNLGYTINNVVSCCKLCNMSKRHYGLTEFIDHITRIHDHNTYHIQLG